MAVSAKIFGTKDLQAAFEGLKGTAAKNVSRRVLKKALTPMAKTAISKAPDDPETGPPDLHRSIIVSSKISKRLKRTASSQFYVDMHMGPTGDGYPQAMIQEFGGPTNTPQPYMRPAWDQHRGSLVGDISELMRVEIGKTIQRARRKALKNAR